MSALREAAQQALEALEDVDGPITALLGGLLGSPDADAPGAKVRTAITALRAALAQQAEPLNLRDPAVQKRLATQWGYVPAAQAEPVEPVAWLQPKTVDGYSRPDLGYETCSKADYGAFPVCHAPPRRTMVPLTDEEIKTAFHAARNAKLGASQDNSRHRLSVIEIARAVEKAVWEKTHGQA